ncbi:pancreatic lipase-related protein 2-like [Bacillus rossius redtenbacheri]|uniref:pancreatic lipase-related protein 2-like n=1 Tax=Bacillus rossius redtenbacheri TaxID=93214 RepID=UPI002FDD1F54
MRTPSAFVILAGTCLVLSLAGAEALLVNVLDVRYWRCVFKKTSQCPDDDIKFFLYTRNSMYREMVDVARPASLKYSSWDPDHKNVIIIHGFNGTESKVPMTFIRNAYLVHGGYNVFTVEWASLTRFPCYLSALSNTKLVAQCSAQLYSFLTAHGALATKIHCVGHSLGAHICGMMSGYLSHKQHKIIGLDPARPLVRRYGSEEFRLTRDDAHVVQVIHTNAGALGEVSQVGHVDFCVNGGRFQPGCRGHRLRRARCSHFQSACYFAQTVMPDRRFLGVPCSAGCPATGRSVGRLPGRAMPMGEDTPDGASGMYCVTIRHNNDCPFD